MQFSVGAGELLKITDSVLAERFSISSFSVFAKDTHIYVPSSRYYVDMKGSRFQKTYPDPVNSVEVEWKINKNADIVFDLK